ncbi:MAG TPA: PKD domain-containing protein [Gaiellaceae bacterium]|nr:PKD domain-containing protein [Gaiellaceae bacterium]
MSLPQPVAEFTVSPRRPSTTDVVQFVDCSHDPGAHGIAWRAWDFGDGETSVGASPVHRYRGVGVYDVTLTLATYDGRVGRQSRRVQVAGSAVGGA